MTPTKLEAQRGSFTLSTLFLVILLAFLGVVVARVVPTYLEYLAIKHAVQKAKEASTALEAQEIFNKASQVDDFTAVTAKDLQIEKQDETFKISFAYEKEVKLIDPVYLLIKYSGKSK